MTVPVPGPSGLQAGPYFGEAAESGSKVRSSGRDRIRGERLFLHQPKKRLMGSTGPSIFSKVPGDAHESCIDWDDRGFGQGMFAEIYGSPGICRVRTSKLTFEFQKRDCLS